MNEAFSFISRRKLLARAGLLTAGTLAGLPALAKTVEPPRLFDRVGSAGDPGRAVALKAQGIQFMTANTSQFLVPDKSDDVFTTSLDTLKACPLPILACNSFIRSKHLLCP